MKNKLYRKYFVITIIGLFIITAIHPVVAIVDNEQENKSQTKTTMSNTYTSKTTNLYCLVNNLTDVQYHLVFIHPFVMNKTHWIGVYRDIVVKGKAQILELWYPLLGSLNILPKWLFTFDNKDVTLEIKLLIHGSVHEYNNPDSFELGGRAIGVTLTIEE